jgi:hypothetical protein
MTDDLSEARKHIGTLIQAFQSETHFGAEVWRDARLNDIQPEMWRHILLALDDMEQRIAALERKDQP